MEQMPARSTSEGYLVSSLLNKRPSVCVWFSLLVNLLICSLLSASNIMLCTAGVFLMWLALILSDANEWVNVLICVEGSDETAQDIGVNGN